MKRFLLAAMILVGFGFLVAHYGSAQTGPKEDGPGGAVVRNPLDTTSTPAKPPQFSNATPFLDSLPKAGSTAARSGFDSLLLAKDAHDINQDIQVTQAHGQWLILVQSYRGTDAHKMAREMVMELRNSYKLNAYTFNFSAEERRKEYDRVKELIEKQKEYLKQNNMPLDQPIRVKHIRIEENVAVLVGGYATDIEARRELDRIRKLKAPDPSKVKLDIAYFRTEERTEKGNKLHEDARPVNPFTRSGVVRNPAQRPLEAPAPAMGEKSDLELLKRLNASETYSLLKCKKPITLAIKQFQTPTVVQSKDAPSTALEKIGFRTKPREKTDYAATDAHNLADTLRKQKLDAYVLHDRFCSVVTVGAFDSLQDPNLRSMQNLLETRLNSRMAIGMMPRPLPMEVPGFKK